MMMQVMMMQVMMIDDDANDKMIKVMSMSRLKEMEQSRDILKFVSGVMCLIMMPVMMMTQVMIRMMGTIMQVMMTRHSKI